MLQSIEFKPASYYMPEKSVNVKEYDTYSGSKSNYRQVADVQSPIYKDFPKHVKDEFERRFSLKEPHCFKIIDINGQEYFSISQKSVLVGIAEQVNIWLKENPYIKINSVNYALSSTESYESSGVFIIYDDNHPQ